jgi:hypothetical protein
LEKTIGKGVTLVLRLEKMTEKGVKLVLALEKTTEKGGTSFLQWDGSAPDNRDGFFEINRDGGRDLRALMERVRSK